MKKIDWKAQMKFRRPSLGRKRSAVGTPKTRRPATPRVRRPAIKGPEIAAPAFLADLVADLRERRLLPLAIALAIGIVAVPVVIAASGSKAPPPPPADTAAPISQEVAPAVLAYDPGVRDYRERLAGLTAKDPFAQKFKAPSVETAELSNALSAGAVEDATISTSTSKSDSVTVQDYNSVDGSSGGGGGGKGGSGSERRYVSYTAELRAGEAGGELNAIDAAPFDFVPGAAVPVAVYLGAGGNGKTALFLVSSDVTDVAGGVCTLGGASCDLLLLKRGDAADLTFGPDGKTYRIKVQRIKRVISDKPAG